MTSTNRFQQVMAVVLVCALCGGIAAFNERRQAVAEPPKPGSRVVAVPIDGEPQPPVTNTSVPTTAAPPLAEVRSQATADVIRALSPTVVTIATVARRADDRNVPDTRIQTGVVIDPRGYILTMWFDDDEEKDGSAKEEQQLVVRFSNPNQQEYPAEVVENDRLWGLALLKVAVPQPVPAISLQNIREPEFRGAVFVVPAREQKRPLKGRITSTAINWGDSTPYHFIEANIKLPAGESGSLMVSDRGVPLGIWSLNIAGGSSYAVPLKAVQSFINLVTNIEGGGARQAPADRAVIPGFEEPVYGESSAADAFLQPRREEPDVSDIPASRAVRGSDPELSTRPPAVATGRRFQAVIDSPAEQKLIEQLQSQESAAAELATRIRHLQASGLVARDQSALTVSQSELKRLLSNAFDLKLQLEELQVKELQSRLSRLERQIGQRRALREKIIVRRAAEMVEDGGLRWEASATPQTQPPSPVGKRHSPTPTASPAVVEKLRKRADLLFESLKSGRVAPSAVLSAIRDLARVDPETHADRIQALVEVTRRLYAGEMLTEAEFLEIEAAYEDAKPSKSRPDVEANEDEPSATRNFNTARNDVAQICMSGPADMEVSIGGEKRDLGAPARYYIQRHNRSQRVLALFVQFAPGSDVFVAGRLTIYPSDVVTRRHPGAHSFLENSALPFAISEEDTRAAWDGDVVTKVVVLRDPLMDHPVELETLDSTQFPPGARLIEQASRKGAILAVLRLSRDFDLLGIPTSSAKQLILGPQDRPQDDSATAPRPASDLSPVATDAAASVSRPFPLRFKLASEMVDDLRQILLGRAGHEARPSADNQQILVVVPPDVMQRVQTFIAVMDWPDGISRGSNFEYPRETVLRAARSFFYACAIEDATEVFSKLLSLHVLATLKGDTKSDQYETYIRGGIPDAEWEKTLRADWPGKKEAIQRLVREWNRYPMKRITERDGVAIGFGVKYFCSVSFEGAPQEFYDVAIEPDRPQRSSEKPSYFFSSLPPWWKANQEQDVTK